MEKCLQRAFKAQTGWDVLSAVMTLRGWTFSPSLMVEMMEESRSR